MEFKTEISSDQNGIHHVYGHTVSRLMQHNTFTDMVFLLFSKRLPTPPQRAFLDVLLVAAAEHGIAAPSLYMPRISVSSGNSLHVGIAAGVLGMGEVHGGAGEAAARLFERTENAQDLVAEYQAEGKRMPGFGHKIYKDEDPRAALIYTKAEEFGLPLAAFKKAYEIEHALAEAKGKKLPLNIDGAFAAGVLALGLPPGAAKALFVLARVAGMGAHALEEQTLQSSYRRLSDK